MIHLLVPYLSFLLLLYPVEVLFFSSNHSGELFIVLAKPFVGGRALKGITGVFWFMTCLFLVQVVMHLLFSKLKLRDISLMILLFIVIGYINSTTLPNFWLPWNANVIFAAIPFYFLGYMCKTEQVRIGIPLAFLGSLTGILLLMLNVRNTYDMKYAYYGIPFITLCSSISFIVLLVAAAKIIARIDALSIPFIMLGKASMVIMFLHQFIQLSLREFGIFANESLRVLAAILIPLFMYLLISRIKLGRAVLLGSKQDFYAIWRGRTKSINSL